MMKQSCSNPFITFIGYDREWAKAQTPPGARHA